jgi:hypothetical protein
VREADVQTRCRRRELAKQKQDGNTSDTASIQSDSDIEDDVIDIDASTVGKVGLDAGGDVPLRVIKGPSASKSSMTGAASNKKLGGKTIRGDKKGSSYNNNSNTSSSNYKGANQPKRGVSTNTTTPASLKTDKPTIKASESNHTATRTVAQTAAKSKSQSDGRDQALKNFPKTNMENDSGGRKRDGNDKHGRGSSHASANTNEQIQKVYIRTHNNNNKSAVGNSTAHKHDKGAAGHPLSQTNQDAGQNDRLGASTSSQQNNARKNLTVSYENSNKQTKANQESHGTHAHAHAQSRLMQDRRSRSPFTNINKDTRSASPADSAKILQQPKSSASRSPSRSQQHTHSAAVSDTTTSASATKSSLPQGVSIRPESSRVGSSTHTHMSPSRTLRDKPQERSLTSTLASPTGTRSRFSGTGASRGRSVSREKITTQEGCENTKGSQTQTQAVGLGTFEENMRRKTLRAYSDARGRNVRSATVASEKRCVSIHVCL